MTAIPHLAATDLCVSYGNHRVLDGINLSVKAGEVVACLGRSGCGKTTLLKALTLFVIPEAGRIAVDGIDSCADGEAKVDIRYHRERVCIVFQDHSLFPNLTGLENITFAALKRNQKSRSDINQEAFRLADQFGLSRGLLERYPAGYSGGEQQRLALIRALILAPEVLLLDEPTSSLDPESIASVIEAIRQLRQESAARGLSVVLVTHLARFAEEIADRIIFLHEGRVVEDRHAKRFFTEAQHPAVEAFSKRFRYAM